MMKAAMNQMKSAMTETRLSLLFLLSMMACGCGGGGIKNEPVDSAKAKEILKTAMESWKKGDDSTALSTSPTPIYVIDPDWQAGIKLKDFEIVGNGESIDAQWVCKVKLTVKTPAGQESKKEATFTVSTAPNQTVSRKLF